VNFLYYGDNLDVLRRYVHDDTVDLVYLDPPFKSNQDYNVLFAEKDGTGAASQFKAFEDTWEWNQASAAMYQETVERGGRVSDVMQAFRQFLGTNDMLAYLTMMAPRLVELRRVLKPTGSIYLHCDPTASHYLKLLMDAVFGPINFKNEIAWQRTNAHNTARQFGRVQDTLLFYVKGEGYRWNDITTTFSPQQLKRYRKDSRGRLFTGQDMTASRPNSNSGKFEWRGTMPPPSRGWGYEVEQLEEWWKGGRILTKADGTPRMDGLIVYLDEKEGKPLQSMWTDIQRIPNTSAERLGYPTQKPEALLERIVRASSNEGDTVLDPFCGCGTAIAVAQRLNRQWIGIDITHLAIGLIKSRLRDAFGDEISKTYKVIGEPVSEQDAMELAKEDPFQFQWWALGLVGARRTEQRKGADQGIDGRLYFHDEGDSGKTKQIILSVKSGHVSVRDVRDLRGVIEREKAEIGVLISLADVTKPMTTEAASAGFYKSVSWQKNYPRLQILTIAELLSGGGIAYPHVSNVTFKRAPKAPTPEAEQLSLGGETGKSKRKPS
jgi:site-specific DNA-methyltransferase (adenine-specific)